MTMRRSRRALPEYMKALCIPKAGVLQKTLLPLPMPKPAEVLIKVFCAGVNRADLLQLKGLYPLPEDASAIPGLEVAGEIVALGKNVVGLKIGDRVAALVNGGGYAQYCTAPAALLLPLPTSMPYETAAALPEALYTACMALFYKGKLTHGESVLIHSGASGIGTMAIQIARASGAIVYATAGTKKKCDMCLSLGARNAFHYQTEDFALQLQSSGVDVVVDTVGGDFLPRNISVLKEGGRLVVIGFLRGAKAEIPLASLLFKELSMVGVALRRQSLASKKMIKKHVDKFYPAVRQGEITPVIDSLYPLEKAEKALKTMEQNLNIGKIVLQV